MVHQFQIGPMLNFVYLITCGEKSFVVDPWPDLIPWEKKMGELGSTLAGVLLTHTHFDHAGGVKPILQKYNVPIYLHSLDAHRLSIKSSDKTFHFVNNEDQIPIGSENIEVWHTPGHSAGEVCYLLKTQPTWQIFTGDTVFVGNVGRTDLDTGSTEDLFQTLQRLKTLPQNTIIYPGHNYGNTPTTTIGRECRESAPFLCKTVAELDGTP